MYKVLKYMTATHWPSRRACIELTCLAEAFSFSFDYGTRPDPKGPFLGLIWGLGSRGLGWFALERR